MNKESYVIVKYMEKPYFFEGLDNNDRAIWRSNVTAAIAFESADGARSEAKDNELHQYKIEPVSQFLK